MTLPSRSVAVAAQVSEPSDDAIIASIQNGDAAAFETMARRYGPALCTYAYRYVRSRETVEELVQEVFLRIWQQGAQWTVRETLSNYLYGAVRNRAFNYLRHVSMEQRWLAHADVLATADDATQHVESADLATAVRAAIASLSSRQRAVVTLRWYHQLSYAEIAAVTHTTPRSVETSIGRALKTLRSRLAGIFP